VVAVHTTEVAVQGLLDRVTMAGLRPEGLLGVAEVELVPLAAALVMALVVMAQHGRMVSLTPEAEAAVLFPPPTQVGLAAVDVGVIIMVTQQE